MRACRPCILEVSALPGHDMSKARSWLVLCSAAALAATSSAQQPVFRAGTDYVRVDVVVTDKNDRPITDLKKEDFEIVEHDRAQTIEDFEFVSVPMTARAAPIDRAAAAACRRRVECPAVDLEPIVRDRHR